jgi:hypothetical protein
MASGKIGPSDVDQGDTVDFEIWGPQLEVSPYATSFIPTTTAALTRNAETGNVITLNSSTASTAATLTKPSGTVSCDYLDITDSTVDLSTAGKAKWYAGMNSGAGTRTTGWIFTGPASSGGWTWPTRGWGWPKW